MWLSIGFYLHLFVATFYNYENYGKVYDFSKHSRKINPSKYWEKMPDFYPPCITFSVYHNTTCNDMCRLCRHYLGQTTFYFTDNVCLHKDNTLMCYGTPIPSTNYTCCVY